MTDTNIFPTTPVGRVISEAIFTPTEKGYQGKPLDKPLYYIQLAIPKTAPELRDLFDNCKTAANAGFTNREPERQDFAWKFKDGDNDPGRDGFKGCYIFSFRSQFAPNAIVDQNHKQIIDKNQIKPGYQVQVAYSVKANGDVNKPGIYLNLHMVKLVAEDKLIVTGPSAAEVFGQTPAAIALQPGALANPSGPGAVASPTYPADPGFLAGKS